MDDSGTLQHLELTTLDLQIADGVATVTLDRPDVYNAFNPTMVEEMGRLWRAMRIDPDVRAVVLTGRGDRAFCTGIDRKSIEEFAFDPMTYDDPGRLLGPKSQEFWKPVVAAVNGMACGGAFYMLGEADIIVSADHATFFDPHVSFGMVAAYEPILLLRKMPFSEVLRMALAGADEHVSAATAQQLGLVNEVTTLDELLPTAHRLAAMFAAKPPQVIRATLRTLWEAKDLPISQATKMGNLFLQLGLSTEMMEEGNQAFLAGEGRTKPRIR